MRFKQRPSQREVRNAIKGLKALYQGGEAPAFETAPVRAPTGKQEESKVNDAGREWARTRNGELYRNRRGMVHLASGKMMPIGLGPNGAGDLIGPMTVTITPEMVGRTVAIYSEFESKTPIGRIAPHQLERIQYVTDLGGIAGVCRNAQDFEDAYQRWLRRS